MIVYQNSLITLTYFQEADILSVTWPNPKPYSSAEVQESITKVFETIKNYNCRKLLIDASGAEISMENEEFRRVLSDFVSELSNLGIQKLARIITSDLEREENISNFHNKLSIPYKFYDISNRQQALNWLMES
jgi:hypothetical protein